MKANYQIQKIQQRSAVIALVLTTAIISSACGKLTSDLDKRVNLLQTSLNLAKTEAIKQKVPGIMCRSIDGAQCDKGSDLSKNTGWGDGWIVFLDTNRNAKFDPGTDQLLHSEKRLIPAKGLGAILVEHDNEIIDSSTGYSKISTADSITFAPEVGGLYKTIVNGSFAFYVLPQAHDGDKNYEWDFTNYKFRSVCVDSTGSIEAKNGSCKIATMSISSGSKKK